MKIGYARVSSSAQKLDMQLDALTNEGCEKVFSEKLSSSKPLLELEKCISHLREGDTLVVYKLDRLGRRASELMVLLDRLNEMGVNLCSIKENIDMSTPIGRAMIQMIFIAAELDKEVINERRRDGMEAARARGRKGGRPRASQKTIDRALKMYDSRDYSIVEIQESTGLSKTSLYRYIEERKEKIQNEAAKEFTKA